MVKEIKKSACLFCSLGCGVCFRREGEHITQIDYDLENPVNRGSLCPRGHYNFEIVKSPKRFFNPRLGNKDISWDEAISMTRSALKHSESAAILVSGMASNEEAYLAAKLANALGIKNISSAGDPSDLEAYSGSRVESPKIGKIEESDTSDTLLIIGDVLTRSPVMSQRINKVKYGKRGNKVIVIDPDQSHTSWFATAHLKNAPGTEALVLAAFIKIISGEKVGLDLKKVSETVGIPEAALTAAANDFNCSQAAYVLFAPSKNKLRNDLINYFIRVLCALSPGKNFISFYSYGNTLGVNHVLDRTVDNRVSYFDIIKKIEKEEIKTLLMLGEDFFFGDDDLGKKAAKLDFSAIASFFPVEAGEKTLVLPLAPHFEDGGSFVFADGRLEKHSAVMKKFGPRSGFDIMSELLNTAADRVKIRAEANEIASKGAVPVRSDLQSKMEEALQISALERSQPEEITHFGNNGLASGFFWYRLKNEE